MRTIGFVDANLAVHNIRPFTLRDWEAKARPRALCRVMKPQPEDDLEPSELSLRYPGSYPCQYAEKHASVTQLQDGEAYTWRPAALPGDEVWYRETWRPMKLTDNGGHRYADEAIESECFIEYKADQPVQTRYDNWRSPATMPQWASRRSAVVKSVRAVRAAEISPEMGVPMMNMVRQFNRDNPRTPYESNPWVWVYEMEEKA